MKPRVSDTFMSELVNVGRFDLSAKTADIRESHVISHNDKKVRSFLAAAHFDELLASWKEYEKKEKWRDPERNWSAGWKISQDILIEDIARGQFD